MSKKFLRVSYKVLEPRGQLFSWHLRGCRAVAAAHRACPGRLVPKKNQVAKAAEAARHVLGRGLPLIFRSVSKGFPMDFK